MRRGPRTPGRQPLLAAAIGMLLAVTVSSGCSAGPSATPEAFCETLRTERARLVVALGAVVPDGEPSGLLEAAMDVIATVGVGVAEFNLYFKRLADVAPPPIEVEMREISRLFDLQVSQASGADLDSLAGGILTSFQIAAPLRRVNEYATTTCGQPI